jgi:hypothetical protein
VRAFAKEADAPVLNVQARAHPVPVDRRGDHVGRLVEGDAANAAERILDDCALQLPLPLVGDVREHRAAAPAFGSVDAIGRPLHHEPRRRPDGAALRLLDFGLDHLTGNGAGHQHHGAVVPRNHAAAGRRTLDRQP